MKKLAVVAPHVGVVSESFIRRHMLDLHPNHTCVIAESARGDVTALCRQVPLLLLKEQQLSQSSYLTKGQRKLRQKLGLLPTDLRYYAIKKFLQQQRVEVILAEYLDYSLGFIDIAQELGIPLYAHAHGYDVSINLQREAWQEKYQRLNDIEGIITVSSYSQKRLEKIGISTDAKTIPCGVSLPMEIRSEKLNSNQVSLIAIGRMVAKKAPILLLDAFRRALAKTPNLHLTYVGDGPLYAAVEQFVRAFGLEEDVSLRGSLPNEQVIDLLASADLFVQHSITCPLTGDQEGLPVAVLEALAHGKPVISTRHTGIPEAVVEGSNGLLVDEGDTVGMAEAIVALASDDVRRQAMGSAARTAAEAKFSWELEKQQLSEFMKLM